MANPNPKWQNNPYFTDRKLYINQPSKALKVPEVLIDEIREYAKAVDRGELPSDVNILLDLFKKVRDGATGYKPNSASQLIKAIKEI